MLIQALLLVATLVSGALLAYFFVGFAAFLLYEPKQARYKAENVRLVVPTIGAEHVRDSLLQNLTHHTEMFAEYDIYCLTDEGADLQDELLARDDVETVVVPDDYECDAVAKGRAIQYFIDTVVADAPEYWYSFIDDDNLVKDDQFLYEIPYYEEHGYGAMNAVLDPRKGNSNVTYVMDHVRLLDDISVFRAFTGLFGRPYIGFHGELLTARGDVLLDVGFDRETIVEDFAFAAELIENDVRTWQSGTHVSILSPHTVVDLFKQRSRWFIGTWNLLFTSSPLTRALTGIRFLSWIFAIVAGPIGTFLWYYRGGVDLPGMLQFAPAVVGVVYGGTYLYGTYRVSGIRSLPMALGLPLYAAMEAMSPFYAIFFSDRDFTVIEK